MNYKEIEEVIEKYPHYTFPIQADDEDGHKIIIIEGHEDVILDDNLYTAHFYRVFTYLEGNKVRINTYYDFGAETEKYQ